MINMNWNKKKILVTGGNGFLGKNLISQLKDKDAEEIISPSSSEFDLRNNSNCKELVQDVDIVFHLAGRVGGIGFNQKYPGDVFYDNLMMGTQLLHESKEANVEKFIGMGTVCSYPKFATIPFTEESLWDGFPEETNASYGLSKKMMIVQSQAYKQQYGFDSITLIPTNFYGPEDDFKPETSHVIPALILKFEQAIKNNSNEVILWGDGTPSRDFLHIHDAARGVILAAEKYNKFEPINLGSQIEVTIKELANRISKLMNFNGQIIWDVSRPNGQPRRCVSYEKAKKEFGFEPEINFNAGLKETIEWFHNNNEI
jgi:GDP-L-fucose synthase